MCVCVQGKQVLHFCGWARGVYIELIPSAGLYYKLSFVSFFGSAKGKQVGVKRVK